MTHSGTPRLDRSVTLHMQGDFGLANLHRICGWLSQTMGERTGPNSRFAVWSGGGAAWAARWVSAGMGDLSLTVPACAATMAVKGTGLHENERFAFLRALATLPQTDRLLFAIDQTFGVTSMAELREKRPPLRISTAPDDNANTIGFAAHKILAASGITRKTLRSWGGDFVEATRPDQHLNAMRDGEADAVISEAIMTPWWSDLADSRDLAFISFEDGPLKEMETRFGWPRATVAKQYLRGMEDEVVTLDFSDFLVIVREDMPEDVAHLLTWCLVETREELERQYRHLPPERSPVTYPLIPQKMAKTPIPLHPGAARYYREADIPV